MTDKVNSENGRDVASFELDKLNRHGIIAGARAIGKMIALIALMEQLSFSGIPMASLSHRIRRIIMRQWQVSLGTEFKMVYAH